jgi:two-component system, NtrC family, response regulator HydG
MARILVVDDEAGLRDSLRRALTRQGHVVDDASAVDDAIRKLEASAFDLLLTDIRLKDKSGLEIVAFARQKRPDTRIVVMTAFGSVNLAVDAMRVGADDFLEKPFRMDAVISRLDRALESVRLARQVERLERENEILRDAIETLPVAAGLVGGSTHMSRVRDLIDRVAVAEASVLIRGETGTGKELVARAIHRLSRRSARPFVAFDCSTFAEGVLESELFGHEKGAFTGADRRRIGRFELADTGTLFLDEVGDLATGIQIKLLRVLQERTFARVGGVETVAVDVRILAATNRDLDAALRDKTFREDLYYRLNVVTIHLPPLREHLDDIPALVDLFVARYGRRPDGGLVQVAPEALAALQSYLWPGNVRQLENVVHRATVLCRDGIIQFEDVSLELDERGGSGPLTTDLRATLNAVEQGLLERAVREHHGNLTAAGRALGIERNLLRYKLRKHGLR